MSFQPVSFSPFASVLAMGQGTAAVLEGLQSVLAAGVDALGALDLPGSLEGIILEQAGALRSRAVDALGTPARFLAVTPFQHTVGTRKGEYGFLTPEQALQTLAGRFADAGVGDKPQALILLVVATPSPSLMARALEGLNAVYPIAELEQAMRRARALATLETDKFIIPDCPGFPPWGVAAPQKDAKGRAVAKTLGGMLAATEGAAKGAQAPMDMLAGFAQKQAAKLLQKAADLRALASSMSGGMDAWAGVCLEGTGVSLFRQISTLEPPFDASCKCSSLLCWMGEPQQVAFYKESLGL